MPEPTLSQPVEPVVVPPPPKRSNSGLLITVMLVEALVIIILLALLLIPKLQSPATDTNTGGNTPGGQQPAAAAADQTFVFRDTSSPATKLYLKKGFSGQPVMIAEAFAGELSPDGKTVAYIKGDGNGNPDYNSDKVYLYDVATGQTISFTATTRMAGITWYPKSNYLVVDSGTDIIRGQTIYSFPGHAEVTTLRVNQSAYAWVDDATLVYVTPVQLTHMRPFGSGGGMAINSLHLPDMQTKTLVSPKDVDSTVIADFDGADASLDLTNYTREQFYLDGKVYYNFDKQHWVMDKDGSNQMANDPTQSMLSKLRPALQNEDGDVASVKINLAYPNWMFVEFSGKQNSGDQTPTKLTVYFYDANHTDSLQKLSANADMPSW